jgi:hypothetical protein
LHLPSSRLTLGDASFQRIAVIPVLALAVVLLAEPVPGDGLRLAPDPAPGPAPAFSGAVPAAPGTPWLPVGAALGGLAAGVAALAAGLWTTRREDWPVADPAEPLVVFVGGHGSGPAPGIFAHLVTLMGLDPADARYFDYRWADGGADHVRASQGATADETADALAGYLAGLSALGRPLYLVGFSKGGAGIAELVARWDRGQPGAENVQGAALLDPPLAAGIHGFLQSLGTLWGPLADDGGYRPVTCSLWSCTDSRAHLGEASGVQVMVVRNPQSGVANFADLPAGLTVYEASDGGPGFWETLFTRPWALAGRIGEAHTAVLHDPRVAGCIAAQIRGTGSCPLPAAGGGSNAPSWLENLVPGGEAAGADPRLPSLV